MARRRRTTRRRNPRAILINPRRRRTTRKRRTVRRRRRNSQLVVKRRNPRRRNARRRTVRRRNTRRRTVRRRNTRRRTTYRRRNTRRRTTRRRNTRRAVARRRNPSRRRRSNPRRRRNPGAIAGMKSGLRKIPFVGGILAEMAGFMPFALFGALGVEPTKWAVRMLGPYFPQVPASLFYVGTSALVAALVAKFAPLDASTRQKLAIGIAAAGGGVGYYKWSTGQDTEVATEMGLLEVHGGFSGFGGFGGYGEAYNVVPMSSADSYGALVYGS